LSVVNGERPMIPEIGEQEGALADAARRYAHDVLAPGAAGWDERDEFPRAVFAALCGRGLDGVLLPREIGVRSSRTLAPWPSSRSWPAAT